MNALLITLDYPSEENPASCAFIHTRVKAYLEKGIQTSVFVVGKNRDNYYFDGITVERGGPDDLVTKLQENLYDKLLIHFFTHLIYEAIKKASIVTEILVWVHGIEALSWRRRLFNLETNFRSMVEFIRYISINRKQLKSFGQFVRDPSLSKTFIFVSNWMRQATEKDLGLKINKSAIIPNMIDTTHFRYLKKGTSQRNHILILRSFSTRKYANDISMAVVNQLARRPVVFNELSISIYGQGILFQKLTRKVKCHQNVRIYNKFLDMGEMAAVHQSHGIILIPTRQDAQGVTMCEAMSSGLVPVTSHNTAIPEFLTPECGFLTHSTAQLTEAIVQLHNDPDKFDRMSSGAASHIRKICSRENTLDKELKLILA